MAKNIKRTILSEKSPRNRHIAWAEPKGENVQLNIFNNGKWRPIAGGGTGSSTSNAIMINAETDFNSLRETIITSTCNKLNIDINDGTVFDTMSQQEREQFENTYAEEALALGLTTEDHGKVVETVYDSNTDFIRMLCEDGFIIRPYGDPIKLVEFSPKSRYQYTTLGGVRDAFYGDTVPNHVVHNLTDTIVRYNNSLAQHFIYNLAAYNPNFTSTDRTSQITVDEITSVSLWIGHVLDDSTNTFVADNIILSVGKSGGEVPISPT